MFWYGPWGWGPWLILPIVMCVGMVAMLLLMRGPGSRWSMGGWCGGGHADDARPDPALDALRQRFARGELTLPEYEERRQILLAAGDDRQLTEAIGV